MGGCGSELGVRPKTHTGPQRGHRASIWGRRALAVLMLAGPRVRAGGDKEHAPPEAASGCPSPLTTCCPGPESRMDARIGLRRAGCWLGRSHFTTLSTLASASSSGGPARLARAIGIIRLLCQPKTRARAGTPIRTRLTWALLRPPRRPSPCGTSRGISQGKGDARRRTPRRRGRPSCGTCVPSRGGLLHRPRFPR